MKCEYDKTINQFPRKLDGTLEDVDIFIDCQHGNRVYSYGHGILQAYIPSIIRGNNVIKYTNENFCKDIIYDIEKTDSEVLFKFKAKYDSQIIPLLKPKTSGASISPFSTRNLPKSDYKIPDGALEEYKQIVAKIPRECILNITHSTNAFIKSLATKRETYEDIKTDMVKKGLKAKEYIHSIGQWDRYIKYLKENLC